MHPKNQQFVAQSAGNYILAFSTKPPYTMDKHKVGPNVYHPIIILTHSWTNLCF